MLPGNLQEGIDPTKLIETLLQLAGNLRPVALVLGSGFEREPEFVDEAARRFPLAGNGGAAIRRIKNPQTLASDCAELGIPHPLFRWDAPPDPQNWVIKIVGGAGGTHIRRANRDEAEPGGYYQRFVSGRSVSALFIGDGGVARIIGFSRQWTSPARDAPYRYGGAVRLRRIARQDEVIIGGWLSGLTRRAGLVGLCSADFIRNADGYHLLEINPRPGATLDIFDSTKTPLMEAHLRASRGEAYVVPQFDDSMASMIAYASTPVAYFPSINWPDWTADHQSPGTSLALGDPVCSVFARDRNAAAARRIVIAKARELQRCWEGDRT